MNNKIPLIIVEARKDERLAKNLERAASRALESAYADEDMKDLLKYFTSNPRELDYAIEKLNAGTTTTITTTTTTTTTLVCTMTTTTSTTTIWNSVAAVQDVKQSPVNINLNIKPCN